VAELHDTRAFLLKSVDYGESDRILTFFTERLGNVTAMARGARRSRKRFGGTLEPFALLRLHLTARPHTDLAFLELAEVQAPHLAIAHELVRMGEAATALELCRELQPPHEPAQRLFAILAAYLGELDQRGASTERLIAFELFVLEHAGIGPRLSECGVCGKPVPPGKAARFDPARGGVVCRADGGGPLLLSGRSREVLAGLQRGAGGRFSPGEAQGAADAIRALTEWHLGRALKGASFLRQVRSGP
jgi:DNA repair protein RecO (recombination protein O)